MMDYEDVFYLLLKLEDKSGNSSILVVSLQLKPTMALWFSKLLLPRPELGPSMEG